MRLDSSKELSQQIVERPARMGQQNSASWRASAWAGEVKPVHKSRSPIAADDGVDRQCQRIKARVAATVNHSPGKRFVLFCGSTTGKIFGDRIVAPISSIPTVARPEIPESVLKASAARPTARSPS